MVQARTRFIRDAVTAEEPFFLWHNTTRWHDRTNLRENHDGITGYGPASNARPDGGNTPFRGEKGVGGFGNPVALRWPGVAAPDTVSAEFMALKDWMPTRMAQLGQADLKEGLRDRNRRGTTTFA